MSPKLYSVYASTMSEVIPNIKEIHGYADDHANETSSGSSTSETEAIYVMENTATSMELDEGKPSEYE